MHTITLVLADGSIRTARTRATTLRGILRALDVPGTGGLYRNGHDELWDENTGELFGFLSED